MPCLASDAGALEVGTMLLRALHQLGAVLVPPVPVVHDHAAQPPHAARCQRLTLGPISAQLEQTWPISAQLKLTLSPIQPKLTRVCDPKVLKLSSNISVVSRRSSS